MAKVCVNSKTPGHATLCGSNDAPAEPHSQGPTGRPGVFKLMVHRYIQSSHLEEVRR